jgi:hypothetical protein
MKRKSIFLAIIVALFAACNSGTQQKQDATNETQEEVGETQEVMNETPSEVTNLFGYLKLADHQSGDQLQLLFDELLWIRGDDTETLLKYGFDPEEVCNDYELYNEKVEWIPFVTSSETTFTLFRWDDEDRFEFFNPSMAEFKQYLKQLNDRSILADITVSNGVALTIKERYVP